MVCIPTQQISPKIWEHVLAPLTWPSNIPLCSLKIVDLNITQFLFTVPNIMHTLQYILLATFSCLKFIMKVV